MRYLVAGTYAHYQYYLRRENLRPSDCHVILRVEDLVGRQPEEIIFYGTWWELHEAQEIMRRAQAMHTKHSTIITVLDDPPAIYVPPKPKRRGGARKRKPKVELAS
jgi:hypothetical protein